jgi:excinuclease UvrABC nuclease subunit
MKSKDLLELVNLDSIMELLDLCKEIEIPTYRGVYICYKNSQVVYVGVSLCVYTRISQHKLQKGVNFFDTVRVLEVHQWWKAILIEDYLIDYFDPILNKNRNSTQYKTFMLKSKDKDITLAKGPLAWNN